MKKLVLFVSLLIVMVYLAWNIPSVRSALQAGQAILQPTQHSSLVDISVQGKPTISASFIETIFTKAHSPAHGTGQALYNLGVKYGIDPVFALAIFREESVFGTLGEARASLSLGNLRCIPDYPCPDGYAWFPNWRTGYDAFYRLIKVEYVGRRGLTTLSQIIPVYAPASDGNDPASYLAIIERSIAAWRQGEVVL